VESDSNFIHLFTTHRRDLEKKLNRRRQKITDAGTLWVSWPKKSGVSRMTRLKMLFVPLRGRSDSSM